MTKIHLTNNCKKIILSLNDNSYHSSVPTEDINDFLILQANGLVSCVEASDKESTSYLAPKLTPKGIGYIAENPPLRNPSLFSDWKFWLTTLIAIISIILALVK